MKQTEKPIVYSCSGCSNLAQIAHDLALNMDQDGIAEMSCISGVIGKVNPVRKLAESDRPIIAIDGCELACTKSCLDACQIDCKLHLTMSSFGLTKRTKEDNSFSESCVAMNRTYDELRKEGLI